MLKPDDITEEELREARKKSFEAEDDINEIKKTFGINPEDEISVKAILQTKQGSESIDESLKNDDLVEKEEKTQDEDLIDWDNLQPNSFANSSETDGRDESFLFHPVSILTFLNTGSKKEEFWSASYEYVQLP